MTENKLQLNTDKTETMLFNSSKLKYPPAPLSICQATISLSDSAMNLGFYPDNDLPTKEHISFICKITFLEIRRISTIRHYLTDDATKTLVVSLALSRIDYCNSLLAGLPQSLVSKLQRVQNFSPSCSPRTSTCSHHSNTQTSSLVARQSPNFHKIACLCFNAITSSTPANLSDLYICILLDLFAPVPTPASSKFHSVSAKRKVIVLYLTLVLLPRIHCHCALEMLQLSTTSSVL